MSDLVINVRQIGNYPSAGVGANDLVLVQQGGLGGPYVSTTATTFVLDALAESGPLGVGMPAPAGADYPQLFADAFGVAANGSVLFNLYAAASTLNVWSAGYCGREALSTANGTLLWQLGGGQAGQPAVMSEVMSLTMAGNLSLPFGTLTVARDPAAGNEVATLNWVSKNTVASFNNRNGPITLNASDIYQALNYTSPITTEAWVTGSINQAIGAFAANYPIVNSFNGRLGDVYLTLSDITCVFFQSGQQPISPTPVATSNDDSIATTQWVTTFITNELEGSGGNLASQSWVLANTVNSFNGRQGVVTLTAADVFDLGAAPLNSPSFSGIPNAPTANPGTSTAQLATTAFVQAAIAGSVAGVASFNTRTGAVTLTQADVTAAGGLANPNANLTGIPTAPTATAGTSTTQLATTAFVASAITAGAVASFNTRTGAVSLTLADVTGVGGAPINNPTFTGTPAAPTASPGTSTTQLATTQFVTQALTAAGGVSSFNSRTGAVTLSNNDITAAGGLSNPNANLTGIPLAPTATPGTNTTQVATTGFVQAALNAAVTSFNSRTGAITLTTADITNAGGAPLNNPNLTGTPTAPTATAGTNNTQLATTAFVVNALATSTAGVTSFNSRTGAITLTTSDITGAGGAPVNNANLTGTPTAPTATAGTTTTQIATTQFVANAISAMTAGVTSFNSRTGAVTLTTNDITAAAGAPIASPAFTGTPSAPTPAVGDNSTNIATTAFAQTAVAPAYDNVGRNLLMNPLFTVAQRGAGPWTANGNYTADRWQLAFSLDTTSVSIVVLTDAARTQIGDETARSCLNLSVTGNAGAGAYTEIIHKIERVSRCSNRMVTLSFWAVAGSGTPKLGLQLAQVFGTGGSPSGAVAIPMQTVTIGAAWARYSVTFALPSMAGKTLGTNGDDYLQLQAVFSSGTTNFPAVGVQSNTFQLWGMQLEYGSVATPLDYGGSPQQQLSACQRYYQAGNLSMYGYNGAGNQFSQSLLFPTSMRANPALAITPTTQTNCGSSGLGALTGAGGSGGIGMVVNTTVTALGAFALVGNWTASADL